MPEKKGRQDELSDRECVARSPTLLQRGEAKDAASSETTTCSSRSTFPCGDGVQGHEGDYHLVRRAPGEPIIGVLAGQVAAALAVHENSRPGPELWHTAGLLRPGWAAVGSQVQGDRQRGDEDQTPGPHPVPRLAAGKGSRREGSAPW